MTRVSYSTTDWPAPKSPWECAVCSRVNSDGRVIWHREKPAYAAQSLPSGIWVYACESARLMGESGQRAIDEWIEARIPFLRAEPVCEREPYLTEGPAHVGGSTVPKMRRGY